MCAPDPNAQGRAQAKIRHANKVYAFRGREIAYMNKSAIIKAKQKDVKGLIKSRNLSDLQVGLETMRGKHYKRVEVASKNIWKEMATGVGAKGGSVSRRSMLRGGSKAQKYLDQIAKSEAALDLARGRGQDILLEKQRRLEKSQDAELRQKQGLPPNFGPPTMYAPVADNRGMSYLSTALSIGSMFATGGTSKLLEGAAMFSGG